MELRVERVRQRFDNTSSYLGRRFNIALRALIVRDLLQRVLDCTILDLGCGDGSLSLQYVDEATHITLVDVSTGMLDIAKQATPRYLSEKVDYINTDIDHYTAEGRFDVVLCIGVLAHVASLEDTVARISGYLKPGGRCIVQITDNDRLFGRILNSYNSRRARHSYGYAFTPTGSAQLLQLASRHGLSLQREHHYLSPFPGMRLLPDRWLFHLERLALSRPSLSALGSERLFLFTKGR
jgi:2-polyprenyl-3-methyl-5-hydroxy-6-metoxy-1,4-benzoquinol methylase